MKLRRMRNHFLITDFGKTKGNKNKHADIKISQYYKLIKNPIMLNDVGRSTVESCSSRSSKLWIETCLQLFSKIFVFLSSHAIHIKLRQAICHRTLLLYVAPDHLRDMLFLVNKMLSGLNMMLQMGCFLNNLETNIWNIKYMWLFWHISLPSVMTYMPQDFRGTLIRQQRERSERNKQAEIDALVNSGRSIRDRYALLWNQQMERWGSLAFVSHLWYGLNLQHDFWWNVTLPGGDSWLSLVLQQVSTRPLLSIWWECHRFVFLQLSVSSCLCSYFFLCHPWLIQKAYLFNSSFVWSPEFIFWTCFDIILFFRPCMVCHL